MQTFIFPPQKRKLFIIWQGHVAWKSFFPNSESIEFLFFSILYVHKKVFLCLCLGCYRCFSAGFYKVMSFDFRFALIDCAFFPTSVFLTHPLTVHHFWFPLHPVYHLFGLISPSVPSIFSLILIFSLPLPSVRREN